jgi:sugar-specific transcriptional regulator TrmB
MLIDKELISKAKDHFGLNIYETKAWLALLSKGVASAGEIAEMSRVPRSRTYDVLESLEKKGFAIIKLGKPVKYIGVKPNLVLDKLRNNLKKESSDRILCLSKIKETEEFAQLESIYKKGISPIKREELSAALKGKSNILNYLREILQNAQKEVVICTDAEELQSKFKSFNQTFNLLSKKNIKIKLALSGNAELINSLSKRLGIKIKKVEIKAKFFIIDKREILFYLSKNTNDEDIAVWLNSEFFISAFIALFEKAME